ncbi:glycerol dehydratase reactivase beta/small subunit family protein [Mangrovibacter yixingensis]|uniref:glycerol dehydratase reactivase beta/small subunit family protein n=1 Tax=Mangrovibacter yixingensis TaxID=1529639 RepID=UPI001CFA6232|nr:glycerol dehydratase reactivase beta/small subunit family protein [Mangrovibacter yixingensis]
MTLAEEKPAIVVLGSHTTETHWQEVLWGIEEEGIPWVWYPAPDENLLAEFAWQAASQSPLRVGIGCDPQQLLVHYQHLDAATPLFRLLTTDSPAEARRTGHNAARLVKGLPFK